MVKAPFLLENDSILIFIILVHEVFLATGESIIKTFECDCKHFYQVVVLKDATESFDHTLLNELLKLLWVSRCCTITESPDCLVFDLNIVVLQNLNEFIYDPCVDAKLDLIFSSSGDVGKYPACFLSYRLFLVSYDIV